MSGDSGRNGGGFPGNVATIALLAVSMFRMGAAPKANVRADTTEPAPGTPATTKSGILGRIDLKQQRSKPASFAVGVIKKFGDDRAGRLGALIAYYGFFSIFPALLALVTILGLILQGNDGLRQDIANSALAQFPIVGDSISESLSGPLTGSTFALVFGILAAVWAGMGMAQACQDAMNEIWSVDRADYPSFVLKRVRSLMMLGLIAVLLVISTSAAQLIGVVTTGVIAAVLLVIATAALNVGVFMVAYRVLTVADISWRNVLPGGVFAGIGYTVVQLLGRLYVSRTLDSASATYGTFAVVIGLLSWIFLIAQVMIIGGEVNVVATQRLWPRSLFAPAATAGDRRSLAAEAEAQRMDETMIVDVQFEPARDSARR